MVNIISELWRLAQAFIMSISDIWTWLNSPLSIGFNIPVIGYVGVPSFVPFDILIYGFLTIIVLWCIKSLLPVG